LTDQDLIEIANTKSQGHLLAISGRVQIAATVTDALLQRGQQQVLHKLAENAGARFSDQGYTTLVRHCERDELLAEKVGVRIDVPHKLFRELLLRATEAVRSRLLAMVGPENRDKIQSVLAEISNETQDEAGRKNQRKYIEAHARVLALKEKGQLDESVFFEFAKADQFAEIVAALALLCESPMPLVESLLQSEHHEAWLIPCRVAKLDWSTVRAILSSRSFGRALSLQVLDKVRAEYVALSQTSAGRVLRFWRVRQIATSEAASPAAKLSG
jgi:uncharacterized protein (DUF2336 family)